MWSLAVAPCWAFGFSGAEDRVIVNWEISSRIIPVLLAASSKHPESGMRMLSHSRRQRGRRPREANR